MRIILASASPRRKELFKNLCREFEVIPATGAETYTKTHPSDIVQQLSAQKAAEIEQRLYGREAAASASRPDQSAGFGTGTDSCQSAGFGTGTDSCQSAGFGTGTGSCQSAGQCKDADLCQSAGFGTGSDSCQSAGQCKDADLCQSAGSCTYTDYLIIGADTVVAFEGSILGKPRSAAHAAEMLRALAGNVHQVYTGVSLILSLQGRRRCMEFAECTNVRFYPMTEAEIEAYVNSGEPMDKAGGYGIQGIGGRFVQGIEGDYQNVVGLPVARLYQVFNKIIEIPLPF